MAVKFAPADQDSYAQLYVEQKNNQLKWQYMTAGGVTINSGLLIKSKYGIIPDLRKSEVQDAIGAAYDNAGNSDSFMIPEIGYGYKVTGNSFPFGNEPATYSIFAITYNNNDPCIRYPTGAKDDRIEDIIEKQIRFSQNVKLEVEIHVALNEKGLFCKTKSLKVSFSNIDSYRDGSVFYTVGNSAVEYPVTRKLLSDGFYVKTDIPGSLKFSTTEKSISIIIK